jgi:metal-responsive CopG/Arc/MetJ family transcriptional regulator
MSDTGFGVSIAAELVKELDELTEQYVYLQASRSEVVEAILTAYF